MRCVASSIGFPCASKVILTFCCVLDCNFAFDGATPDKVLARHQGDISSSNKSVDFRSLCLAIDRVARFTSKVIIVNEAEYAVDLLTDAPPSFLVARAPPEASKAFTVLSNVGGVTVVHWLSSVLKAARRGQDASGKFKWRLAISEVRVFALQIFSQPECMAELDTKSTFEERCPLAHFSDHIMDLKRRGFDTLARAAFVVFTSLRHRGKPFITWPHWRMTPTKHVPWVSQKSVWQRNDSPLFDRLASALESASAAIAEEVVLFTTRHRGIAYAREYAAYPGIVGRGTWWKWSLYTGVKGWDSLLCAHMATACAALRGLLPGEASRLPYVSHNNEEVVIFETAADPAGSGGQVQIHNGGQNTRINVHMGLSGVNGSSLLVYTDTGAYSVEDKSKVSTPPPPRRFTWQEGRVSAIFNDGVDHEVLTAPGRTRRVIAVGCLHPDLIQHPGIYSKAWARRTATDRWDAAMHRLYEEEWHRNPPPNALSVDVAALMSDGKKTFD